ncbi:hypothetical protein M758_1G234900 [Ceratodon purpureus]|nr:hypothetical protein M758_1G234900 [Ceratodon purpureus]
MESWFSWMPWAAVVLWLTWWCLEKMGVDFSPWEIVYDIVWLLVSWIPGLKTAPEDPPSGIEKLSDAVYLLYEPKGTPEIDIVFIHGLQLSQYKDAYWKTWSTVPKDETGKEICWPQTWLSEEFPNARILSVSYDSSAVRTESTGREDVYAVGESLVQEMVDFGKIGQHCPVLFVCHSLGGLVVKQVVLQAYNQHGSEEKYKNFLENIRGFHFYATPHDGSKLADLANALPIPFFKKGPMVNHLKVLNDTNGRLKSNFERITNQVFQNKWKFTVVAEQNATKMGTFYAQVVSKTSATYGHHPCLSVGRDHFQVCKPTSKTDSGFKALTKFIVEDVMTERITTGAQAREIARLTM